MTVQPPGSGGPVERLEEVLPGDGAELVVNLLGRLEFDRQGVQPRFPRAGGATPEVRSHVLDDERTDQLGPRRGQAPRVQRAHRVADHDGRATQRLDRLAKVGDEPLGADRVWVLDVTAPVPRCVVRVHRPVPGQPRQLARPGAAPTHQAVHEDQRLAVATLRSQLGPPACWGMHPAIMPTGVR